MVSSKHQANTDFTNKTQYAIVFTLKAGVVKLVYTIDSKSIGGNSVRVQVPSPASPLISHPITCVQFSRSNQPYRSEQLSSIALKNDLMRLPCLPVLRIFKKADDNTDHNDAERECGNNR